MRVGVQRRVVNLSMLLRGLQKGKKKGRVKLLVVKRSLKCL